MRVRIGVLLMPVALGFLSRCRPTNIEVTRPLAARIDAGGAATAINDAGTSPLPSAESLDATSVQVAVGAFDPPPDAGDAGTVHLAGGEFEMGATDGAPDEQPVHRVKVNAFELDATEVTSAAYERCVDAGACSRPPKSATCNFGRADRGDHPANCVDWNDADSFCRWAGKRLPTEEEWEYAARGQDGRKYPWGNVNPNGLACWNRFAGRLGTCPVGRHAAGDGPFGQHDLAGNVWEWTASTFSASYAKPRDQTTLRVTRGGSWGSADPADLRATTRGRRRPDHRSDILGFRCAR